MKKLILLTVSALAIASLYASNNKKEQIKIVPPKTPSDKIYIDYPKCPSDSYITNIASSNTYSEIPPYKHCTKCNMGAMLGKEGEERCTYCGKEE